MPGELEVRHLRLVTAVAATGSVSAAARSLGVGQSNVAARLSRLERRLGGPLFVRSRTGVRPTPAGADLIASAERILRDLDQAELTVRRLASGEQPVVRLRSEFALAGLADHLAERHPGCRVEHVLVRLAEGYADLVAGRADLAQGIEAPGAALPAAGQMQRRLLVSEPMWAVLPAGHRLAAAPEVRLADLAAERWVARPPGDPLRDYFELVCAQAGFTPVVAHAGTEHLPMLHLVRSGCVGLGSPINSAQPGVVARPLAQEPVRLDIVVLWRTDLLPAAIAEEAAGWIVGTYAALARANNPAYWESRFGATAGRS